MIKPLLLFTALLLPGGFSGVLSREQHYVVSTFHANQPTKTDSLICTHTHTHYNGTIIATTTNDNNDDDNDNNNNNSSTERNSTV